MSPLSLPPRHSIKSMDHPLVCTMFTLFIISADAVFDIVLDSYGICLSRGFIIDF